MWDESDKIKREKGEEMKENGQKRLSRSIQQIFFFSFKGATNIGKPQSLREKEEKEEIVISPKQHSPDSRVRRFLSLNVTISAAVAAVQVAS